MVSNVVYYDEQLKLVHNKIRNVSEMLSEKI
jgi:hypothetical protein